MAINVQKLRERSGKNRCPECRVGSDREETAECGNHHMEVVLRRLRYNDDDTCDCQDPLVSKVSQLLLAVDSGNVNEWKGRKRKDISTDELPDVESSDDEGDDGASLADVVEADNMNFDEEKPEYPKMLTRESSAKAVTDPQSQIDQDDTMSCSDSSSKQSRKHHVTGKRLPWSASDLKILKEACGYKAAPLSFNEIRCLQAMNPSLKRRSLAQIKSRAWALRKC